MIEIKQPKWKTNEILVAIWKVTHGKNLFYYSEVKSYKGMVFSFDGDYVMNNCKRQTLKTKGGRLFEVYAIPCGMCVREDKDEDKDMECD